MEFRLDRDMEAGKISDALSAVMPPSISVCFVGILADDTKKLMSLNSSALYELRFESDKKEKLDEFLSLRSCMTSDRKGRQTDARSFVIDGKSENNTLTVHLKNSSEQLKELDDQDDEVKDALVSLANLVSAGLDGVIIQDLGLADVVHKVFPSLPLHGSTQMTVYNLEGVQVLESLGFKRVVLARELSLEEIRYIKEHTNVELEVFIHGAACVCYSGACFLSQFNGGRSANRGACAQPCRLRYELFDDTDERIAIGNLLSSKDIYGMPYLKELSKMGIDCLKIEGRAKTPEYVSVVTSKYRKYLDLIEKDLDIQNSQNNKNCEKQNDENLSNKGNKKDEQSTVNHQKIEKKKQLLSNQFPLISKQFQ